MPHHGEYEHVKEWLQDHDSDIVDETPPDQNVWYELFHAEDVRLIFNTIYQSNDEAAAKDVNVRWTIDGNVYFITTNLANATTLYMLRTFLPSLGGTSGLTFSAARINAVDFVDKRGLDFKVEVRITSLLGTNQRLLSYAVRETLEVT